MTTQNNNTPTLNTVYDELNQIFLAYQTLDILIGSSDLSLPSDGLSFLLNTVNLRLQALKDSISHLTN